MANSTEDDRLTEQLSLGAIYSIATTERVNSIISMIGLLFIFVTYLCTPYFNKPINRLIFFAAWSNLGVNIASLISTDGPVSGTRDPLCQFQGFLVQMFLGVDAYWSFCMAINVYLAFFRGWTVEQLRTLDIRYLLACYGLSFIPAFVFIFIETPSRGKIYGNAIVWCWTRSEWGWVRIVALYAIVWLTMLFAAIIYGFAIRVIWKKREHLSGYLNPLNENPFTIVTKIEITHEETRTCQSGMTAGIRSDSDGPDYSVQVETQNKKREMPEALRMGSIARQVAINEENAEAWLYARVAILFFLSLLVTWVPSSINRVYALDNPGQVSFALNYASAFVFPLQGLWNVLIYMITSQTACIKLWDDIRNRRKVFSWRPGRESSLTGGLSGGRIAMRRFRGGSSRFLSNSSSGTSKSQRWASLSSWEARNYS